jgi:hypothetical protein
MAALLEILYLIAPGAYLKDDASRIGATGTGGRETGEVGSGDGTPGGEVLVPLQATANPKRRYRHFPRFGIFMYSRLRFF